MRSAPALKNMFLDCIRKIVPANCTHILQKAFFKHALVYYSFPVKKSIYLIWKCKFFCIFFLKNSEGFHNIAVDLSGFSLYNKKDNKEERNG